MLLGSPPDMVHGVPLRETGSAAVCGGAIHSFSILLYETGIGNKNFYSRKNRLYNGRKYGIISFAPVKSAIALASVRYCAASQIFIGYPILFLTIKYGPIAQLGERTVRIRKVVGSIPIRSTIFKENHRQFGGDFSFDHNFTTDKFLF